MSYPVERINAPVSTSELERRWKAVRDAMADTGIDVLVMQANNDFMGGYVKYFTDLPATNGYPATVVFPAAEPMTLISMGPFGQEVEIPPEGDGLRRGISRWMTTPSFASAVFTVDSEVELAMKALAPHARGTIGLLGMSQMAASFADALRAGLPEARFVDPSDMVDAIKAVKSAEEMDMVRACAAMQDGAMKAVLEAIRPGMRDIEVAAVAKHYCLDHGSEQGIYLCGSGRPGQATRFGNRHQQNRTIREGDTFTILVESNGPGGMYTEIGRTCVLGKASSELKEEFAFAVEAQQHALKFVRPGVSGPDIWDAHNDFMRAGGRPAERRIFCHGQGYDMVERPLVRFDDPMPIAAGMNIACHPMWLGATSLNWVCDNFHVGETGITGRLHETPQQIFEI